jgi:hypothetical protein
MATSQELIEHIQRAKKEYADPGYNTIGRLNLLAALGGAIIANSEAVIASLDISSPVSLERLIADLERLMPKTDELRRPLLEEAYLSLRRALRSIQND